MRNIEEVNRAMRFEIARQAEDIIKSVHAGLIQENKELKERVEELDNAGKQATWEWMKVGILIGFILGIITWCLLYEKWFLFISQ